MKDQIYFRNPDFQKESKKRLGCRLYALLLLIVLLLSGSYSYFQYKNYQDFVKSTGTNQNGTKTFKVNPGESVESITQRLVDEGFLSDKTVFNYPAYKIFLKLNGVDTGSIQAGTYQVPLNSTPDKIFSYLISKPCDEVRVTLKEGLRVEEFAEDLNNAFKGKEKSVFSKEEFIRIARNYNYIQRDGFELSFTPPSNLEGYLFPDTYTFCPETKTSTIIEKLLSNFNKKVYLTLKAQLDSNKLKLSEVINLASIVEREGRQVESKRNIADVFLKRLDIGMPLGSDVTTMYGFGYSDVQKTWWRRGVELDKVIELPHPYNTRINTGLPPTPISNPGLASIQAVLDPIHNNYYFFVVGNDNKIYYARNIAEHNTNVCKHLTMTCR